MTNVLLAVLIVLIVLVALLLLRANLRTPIRHYEGAASVAEVYDQWTNDPRMEYYWGEHLHAGYYGNPPVKKDFIQAKMEIDAEKVRRKWEKYGEGVRMVMLNSPYRLLLEPLLEYIEEIARQRQAGEIMTIVVPEFVSNNPITSPLHMNTAELLRRQLKRQPGIVIIDVPYQVHE